ncbi:hypothetical protein MRB53_015825 [Persea americana]|uniref:Uncharacterized protein n=1 Tax=Persea americana TaxID=3435 RepID=A0ACC2M051_PERAE|nr:hypothetical protein MRB53_015825 [Persea americana]
MGQRHQLLSTIIENCSSAPLLIFFFTVTSSIAPLFVLLFHYDELDSTSAELLFHYDELDIASTDLLLHCDELDSRHDGDCNTAAANPLMESFRSGETATPEMEKDPSFVFRHKKTPSLDRLLGLFSQSPSISIV